METVKLRTLSVCAVVAAALCASSAFAQNTTGSIVGHVTDQSGAVITNAKVGITNTGTGQTRATLTNAAGDYTVTLLQPGTYSVTISVPGFSTAVQSNIVLQVQQTVRADFDLVVGSQSQHVEVSSEAVNLDTDSASVGQIVFEKQLNDLPLNGRRFFDLLFVTSGAIQTGGEQSGLRIGTISGDAIAISGGRSSSNGYTVDGTSIMDTGYNTPAFNPSLDSIQEFKVQSKTYSAEYGYSVNQINVSTKFGTNTLHGSAYEYLRNDKLDARDFFNTAPQTKNPLRRNQFGFSLGGPVVVPKVYNGRNKTFFFMNYEGQRYRESSTLTTNVPPTDMLKGIFPFALMDPVTGQNFPQQPDGTTVLPANRISRYGQIMQSKPTLFWPAPNSSGAFNFVGMLSSPLDSDQGTFRVDYAASTKDQLFVRGTIVDANATTPGVAAAANEFWIQNARHYTGTYTHLFTQALVNQFRYGYLDTRADQTSYPISSADMAKLDLKNTFNKMPNLNYPAIALSTYPISHARVAYAGTGGSGLTPLGMSQFMHDVSDSLSWVKGRHTLGMGFSFRIWKAPITTSDRPLGGFTYTGEFSGNQIADMLLGYTTYTNPHLAGPLSNPETGVISRFHFKTWAPYIQDDWKVTPKLTLNFGLRYEYSPAPYEENDAFFWFAPDVPGGGLYCADQKVVQQYGGGYYAYNGRRGPGPTPKWTFAPRFGFAVRPLGDDKTVVRGGYGIFYDTQGTMEYFASGNFWPYGNAAVYTASAATHTLLNTDDLYPSMGNGPVTKGGLTFLEVQGPGVRSPYVQDWSLGVQRQLDRSTLLDVTYTGNVGRALENRTNPNQPFQCNAAHNCDPLAQTPATIKARQPYPNLGTMVLGAFDGTSNYNALDLKVERRASDVTFLAVYGWSKGLDIKSASAGVTGDSAGWYGYQDNHNARGDYGLSSYDVAQRFALTFIYDLPFGRGKPILGDASKALNALVGGWQLNGMALFQGGFPFSITATDLGTVNMAYGERANVVGNPYPSGFKKSTGQWFNTAAFTQPAAGEFGNSGRNIIRAPGVNSWNLSGFKNFKVSERATLQFRFESFNAFNHPQFGFPNANVNSSTFGTISSVNSYYPARRIQCALRFTF